MSNFEFKRRLNAPKDNIGKELISSALGRAKKYRRNTAWFRPSALKVWAPVLKDIVEKDIKIEILASLIGNPGSELFKVLSGLNSAEKRKKELLNFANDIVLLCAGLNLDPSQHSFRHKILQYLIASEKLEIRFAISKPFINEEELFHKKEGYFIFEDNQKIYFEGSFNESEGGLSRQGEHATVWSTQNDGDINDIDNFIEAMDMEWDGQDSFTEIVKVSKETIDRIKSHVADDPSGGKKMPPGKKIDDLPVEIDSKPDRVNYAFIPETYKGNQFRLGDHQQRAHDAWIKNNGKGVLAHATGSGKTITALYSLSKVGLKNDRLIVIIHVPYQPLADQWVEELSHFNLNPVQCYRSKAIWENELEQKLSLFNQTGKNFVLPLVVVDKTFNSQSFQKILKTMPTNKMIYIADECHRFAKKGKTKKLPDATFRLGLSATPFNSLEEDSIGDLELKNFFGEVIDRYDIANALADGVLTPYEYRIVECYLDEEEMELIRFQQSIQARHRGGEDEEPSLAFNIASGKINRIMGQAEEKFIKLKKIVSEEKIEPSIFFSGDGSTELDSLEEYGESKDSEILLRDVERIGKIIRDYDWRWRQFTYHQTFSQKKENLESFTNGSTDALVSVRVLDEGIDIPGIKKAFILASTSNRRQFIQRRGRVLRKSPGKEKSVIYDFICLPPIQNSIASKEMRRVVAMGKDALNKDEVRRYIQKKQTEFTLDEDILEGLKEF